MGGMKTTFDLPEDLVRELKLRAVRDGRKLKDAAAEILRAGLAVPKSRAKKRKMAVIIKDRKTGLLVIQGRRAASRGRDLTPDQIAEILSEQEAQWARDSG